MAGQVAERQRRERKFYAAYSARYADCPPDFAPMDSSRPARPWNPWWYTYRRLLELKRHGARRILDFGCGWGDLAVPAAWAGFEVHGFDITPENVAIARRRALDAGLSDRAHFTAAAAEQLPYAPASFDVVIGIDILHHVDIPSALESCRKVLRPGGHLIFKEPVRSALFDPIRNTALVRRFFPNTMSLDLHVTADERKLDGGDLQRIRDSFPDATFHYFRALARLDRLLRGGPAWEKLDMVLLRSRRMQRFAGFVVIEAVRRIPEGTAESQVAPAPWSAERAGQVEADQLV